jgi:hypothetical protein
MSYPQNDLTHHSDEELFQRVKQNDKEALSILSDRYGTDLYIYIKKIIKVCAVEPLAKHEAQKILTDIFNSLTRDLPPTLSISLEYYLFDLAHTRATNYVNNLNATCHLN